ncbi:Phytoene dehydrogenase-related protein [Sporobacter termitidis DSM 10068]|uniref:Phytoene dehydrogenase-related protein n=1 Tax=Sporobacter termitidis DSM 10068 TaxID=1123282 RepID=A0A1M5XPY5_9FIRM|nr:NAD(P)/FAD-dependent oxidoreductase [Sporobacter termitidis]SHI01860.1 Phytoene dehydrogenase-related protein [Sporobacter termitidis DSM 10068]
MKKLVIIGAGIAGLTCGVYAQKNGFDTEIYEMHTIPGGECTGWDRKGYHFDGCLHWLVGSKPGTALHKIWRDTGALDDTVEIVHYDIYVRYEEGDAAVNFYTDAGKLEKHFLEIAPEDAPAIKKLCGALRRMGDFGMPLDRPMDMMTAGDGLKFAAKNLGSMSKIAHYNGMSMKDLTAEFKNPLLVRAMLATFPEDYTAMAFVTTLAGMNAGDCGFPRGGSRALAQRMAKRFAALGGRLHFNAKVDKILVRDGKAAGIRLEDGREIAADHVVSCADGHHTLTRLLDDKYTPPVYKELFGHPGRYPTVTSALVFLGVDADVPFKYRGLEVRRDTPFTAGGIAGDCAMITHYGFDGTMAPAGKTVLGCYYLADFDYWQALYGDREKYEAEKKKLEADAIAEATRCYPEIAGKIEVTDVVTPMTYVRYCNAWRGSWMTWIKNDKEVPRYYPGVLPGLDGFIMAGMWTLPPGGLPGAGASGRFAAHRLCLQNNMEFKTD